MKPKVLWIEDGLFAEVRPFLGPLINSLRFDLHYAFNAFEGQKKMKKEHFDAIVFDIRIPPSDPSTSDPDTTKWNNLYEKSGFDKIAARLGIKLIEDAVTEYDYNQINLGIFSVETAYELKELLEKYPEISYINKNERVPTNTILKMVECLVKGEKYVPPTD